MKNIKYLLFSLFALLFLSACNSDDDAAHTNPEYLIFGHFFGECIGEGCVEIFKLDANKLYEDSNDIYPGQSDFYNGNFIELSEDLFNKVNGLMDEFPSALLDESEVVIGIPDAGDWGGLYIEYKSGDVHDFWLLDLMKTNVPTEYHDFIDDVQDKILLINE